MKTSMHSDIFRHFRPFGILIQIFEVRFKKSGRKTTEDNYRVKNPLAYFIVGWFMAVLLFWPEGLHI